jgi:hypothetical protein
MNVHVIVNVCSTIIIRLAPPRWSVATMHLELHFNRISEIHFNGISGKKVLCQLPFQLFPIDW